MKKADKYKTILVLIIALLIFYKWLNIEYLLYSAIILGILSLAFASFADLVNKAWYKLAEVLGWLNSKILLTAVFFLVLWPVALLKKIFSPQKKNSGSDSYYITRNYTFEKKDLENTW